MMTYQVFALQTINVMMYLKNPFCRYTGTRKAKHTTLPSMHAAL